MDGLLFLLLIFSLALSLIAIWVHLRCRKNPLYVWDYGLRPCQPSLRALFTYSLVHYRSCHLVANLVIFWILGLSGYLLSQAPLWAIATWLGIVGGGCFDLLFRHEERRQPLIGLSAGNLSAAAALLLFIMLGDYQTAFYMNFLLLLFPLAVLRPFFMRGWRTIRSGEFFPLNFPTHAGGIIMGLATGLLFIY